MSSQLQKPRQSSLSKSTKGGISNKLFISSINPSIPREEVISKLTALIEKITKNPKIQLKKSFNNSYYFAFVEIEDSAFAPKVIESLNGYELNGKKISVEYQRSNPRDKPPQRNFPDHKPKYSAQNTYDNFKKRSQWAEDQNKNQLRQKDKHLQSRKHRNRSQSYDQRRKKQKFTEDRDKTKNRASGRDKQDRKKSVSQDNKYSSRKNYEKNEKSSKKQEQKRREADHEKRRNRYDQKESSVSSSQEKLHRKSRPTQRRLDRKQARRMKQKHGRKHYYDSYDEYESSSRSPVRAPKKMVKRQKKHRRDTDSQSSYEKYKNH